MGVPYERIVKQDLNLGYGTVDVSMPAGGVAVGDKVGLHTFGLGFNVQDFGAKGDGATDDATAIQAAIDALGTHGGRIWFPAGLYRTTVPIVVAQDSIHLEGPASGILSTVASPYSIPGAGIYYTGTQKAVFFNGGAGAIGHCAIKNLGIDAPNGSGIVAYLTNSLGIENVRMRFIGASGGDASYDAGYGILCDGAVSTTINRAHIGGTILGNGIALLNQSNGSRVINTRLSGGELDTDVYGILIDNGACYDIQVILESFKQAVRIGSSTALTHAVLLRNCYFEEIHNYVCRVGRADGTSNVDGVAVLDCYLNITSVWGALAGVGAIGFEQCNGFTVSGCQVYMSTPHGCMYYGDYAKGGVVQGNYFRNAGGSKVEEHRSPAATGVFQTDNDNNVALQSSACVHQRTIQRADSPFTPDLAYESFYVNATAGAVTVNLPQALNGDGSQKFAGKRFTFTRGDATTNTVTIAAYSGETINGVASLAVMVGQWSSITVESTANGWIVISVGNQRAIPRVRTLTPTDSPFSPGTSYDTLICDTTTGPITIQMPQISGHGEVYGRRLTVIKASLGSNVVTILPYGAEVIDGASSNVEIAHIFDTLTIEAIEVSTGWITVSRIISDSTP